MTNYKFEISYDGTKFYGWEHQPKLDTVQGKIETALEKLVGEPVELIGAGRTDAGVHARKMVANAHMETDLSPEEIRDHMNEVLPESICINDVRVASDRFHARYNAVGKLYTYTCYIGDLKPIFNRKYVTVLDYKPDIEAMRKAAGYLIGEHDFKAFCTTPRTNKSTVRLVDRIEIVRKRDLLYFNFHGEGFLRNMVRILVGTLLEVGQGHMTPEQIIEILESKDRTKAGPTAPPQGLCLMEVEY